jgi:hypothetical protein
MNIKLLKYIIIFIGFLFCFDFFFGTIFSKVYLNVKGEKIGETNYAFFQAKEEILLIGGSDIKRHFNPKVIAEKLKLSTFNFGTSSTNIFYQYAILQQILKRVKPKYIIIGASGVNNIVVRENTSIKLLLPYYEQYPEVKSILDDIDFTQKYKLGSKIYPYNSSILDILSGLNNNVHSNLGYEPAHGTLGTLTLVSKPKCFLRTEKSESYFDKFIVLAKMSGAKVCIVQAPRFEINTCKDDEDYLYRTAKKHNVQFLNYINDTSFINHRNLFYDPNHLNNEGSKILTNKFLKDLKL